MADVNFYFDPVCPFAWMTSKWVRKVQAQRDYTVEWRFISLRLLNAHVDYDAQFPPEYEAGHTAGLRLLRAAASIRREHGPTAIGPLYEALGTRIFDAHTGSYTVDATDFRGTAEFLGPVLDELGLPAHHLNALDDAEFDAERSKPRPTRPCRGPVATWVRRSSTSSRRRELRSSGPSSAAYPVTTTRSSCGTT
ncbi:hypothetical protein GA0061091_101292 [Gordonia sp. v-85]|nr:hypothetical protein GA0061091_101292 [Gordonia sp. v-85]